MMGEKDQVTALTTELRDLRRRGLVNIDGFGQLGPLSLPVLEGVAQRYSDDEPGSRIELMRRLLHDALAVYGEGGHRPDAKLLGELFFEDGIGETVTHKAAGDLLDATLQHNNLTEASFNKRRPGMYRDFAAFLLGFVPEKQPAFWRRPPLLIGAAVVVLALIVTAVLVGTQHSGGTRRTANPPSTFGSTATNTGATPTGDTASTAAPLPMLTFDDLGGGSSIINVYPGVLNTSHDKLANGTYPSGETVEVLCKITGRLVVSQPALGEKPRQSDIWLGIKSVDDIRRYAALTYADISAHTLGQLPACPTTS